MQLWNEVWMRRSAIKQLVLKNFKVRYRNMALGVLWSVLNPLVMLSVLVFIFTFVYPNRGANAQYFPIFVLIGLVHYNIFSSILTSSTLSIVEHTIIVRKVAFPRIIIPLSKVLSHLVDALVLVGLLLAFILVFRVPLTWNALWFPVSLFIELVFICGAAFLCSALAVYYRDVLYIVESGLTVFFWMTPIFYSISLIHDRCRTAVFALFLCNPLAGCIETSRRVILQGQAPDFPSLGVAAIVAAVMLVAGIFSFQRLQCDFADYV